MKPIFADLEHEMVEKCDCPYCDCENRFTEESHHTWFSRWKKYPWSILGHIAQGVVAGGVLGWGTASHVDSPALAVGCAAFAALWMYGFVKYQELSFERKVNETGRGDTAGLDSFDFVVGLVPSFVVSALGFSI